MKFKKLLIFVLILNPLSLCAITQELLNEQLFQAVRNGNIEDVESCLIRGADANTRVIFLGGWVNLISTPLITAVKKGYTEIVRLLLEHHINVNTTHEGEKTPLMIATKKGHLKIVRLLLKYGAKVNTRDEWGWTALTYAIAENNIPIVNILLKHGAEIKIPHESIELKGANLYNQITIIELLLNHINHVLDQTDDPETCHMWDQYILDALSRPSVYNIDAIDAFRVLLHHAAKLPLSRKKLESLTAKALGKRDSGEESFKSVIRHLRKNAF